MLKPSERLIVALDVENKDNVVSICSKIGDKVGFYKVGLQLFLAEGRDVLSVLKSRGAKVFLDLKLHDIPNQVAGACREIVRMGVDMTTIHTLGGVDMMEAASRSVREAAEEFGLRPPVLLGVTILTSLNQVRAGEIGITGSISERVVSLAKLAKESGLDGVVASSLEVKGIREAVGDEFIIVTPGIRSSMDAVQDQKRVMSAGDAIRAGSSYLVVGRPILEAVDPVKAVDRLVTEIESGLSG